MRAKLGLPDLAQVTGWSRADPEKGGHDPDRALFGGWRIEDMERPRGEAEWRIEVDVGAPKEARPRVRRL